MFSLLIFKRTSGLISFRVEVRRVRVGLRIEGKYFVGVASGAD